MTRAPGPARVMVLGASGFLGRHVMDALRRLSGVTVLGGGLGPSPEAFVEDWLEIDLATTHPGPLADGLAAAATTVVVNVTGATAGSTTQLVAANVATVAGLLEALERLPSPPRLVHIGSAAEYGRGDRGVAVDETAEARPLSPYGITKLAATRLVVAEARAGRLEAAVLRVFNPLGAGMPESSLPGAAVARFRAALASGERTVRMGPLDAVRDFIDVRDVAAAVAAATQAVTLDAPVVNVGSGTGHTARDLVAALAERVGFRGGIEEASSGSPRSTDVAWQVADISLARRTLGWQPVHDLASSVATIVAEGHPAKGHSKD